MKIIQITGSDLGGGAETVVRQHHHELKRLGHETQLLVGRKQTDDPTTQQIPFRRGPKGVLRTARWLQRTTGLQNLYSPGFRAIEESFAFSPDVLHFHSLHGVDSFAELSVVRRLSKKYPSIISLHDLWLMTGHCGHPLDCPKWKTGCGNCPDLTLYPAINRDATKWNHSRKRRIFRDTVAKLIVPSNWLKEQVQQSSILGHLDIDVVPNPVDVDTFSPREGEAKRKPLGRADGESTVILVAQHLDNPFKGLEEGIRAINAMKTPHLRVMLVGRSAQQASERIDHPCIVLPFTADKNELADYYRAADLLLMPSRGETFGLVAAESMACGTPVIAFHVGGLPDVIGDNEGGVIVQQRIPELMASAADELFSNPADLAAKSANGRQRVESLFTPRQHTNRCLQLYECGQVRLATA